MITKDYLSSLSPCRDRFNHYLTHYKDWSGSLEDFLDLPELTHEDKKWVFFRSIPKDNLRLIASDFAERVLKIYESKYPNDDRPRKAIEAARSGAAGAAGATYAAGAGAANATYAAGAAGAAYAAYAADAAAYAAYAAAYAAYAYAAYAADTAAYAADAAYAYAADTAAYAADAADASLSEEKSQLEIMKKYAREALKEIT